jgi:hypothetical protein
MFQVRMLLRQELLFPPTERLAVLPVLLLGLNDTS